MGRRVSSVIKVIIVIGMQLVISGCITGGAGGIFGFLEGAGFFGGDSEAPPVLGFLPSGPSAGGSGVGYIGGEGHIGSDDVWDDDDDQYVGQQDGPGGGGSESTTKDQSETGTGTGFNTSTGTVGTVATVHNPEPASMALFGAGLVSLACVRRRRRMRRS